MPVTFGQVCEWIRAIAPDTWNEVMCVTVAKIDGDPGYVVYVERNRPVWVGSVEAAAHLVMEIA